MFIYEYLGALTIFCFVKTKYCHNVNFMTSTTFILFFIILQHLKYV